MNKVLLTALCAVCILTLPGCWEKKEEHPVKHEVPAAEAPKDATAPDAAKHDDVAKHEEKTEEIPAKM